MRHQVLYRCCFSYSSQLSYGLAFSHCSDERTKALKNCEVLALHPYDRVGLLPPPRSGALRTWH